MNQLEKFLKTFYIPSFSIWSILEILIIIFVLYKIISSLKDTRAWIVLKGIIVLCSSYFVAQILHFNIIKMVFQNTLILCAVAIVVIFQQDLKRMLEQIGNRSFIQYIKSLKEKARKEEKPKRMTDRTINELADALFELGKAKTGSLIVIEKDVPLNDIIATGISVNADISSALLINIFEKNTPLHDGAVIINKDKIVSATCYLPLSNSANISKSLGTRHRAGIGITEAVDCFVLISSEETGAVSYVENGKIYRNVSKEELISALKNIQDYPETNLIYNPKKHLFSRNLKIKIFSAILGIAFWVVAMSTLDPITTRTIRNVPITIQNEEVIEQINKTYDLNGIKTVDIKVQDKQSVLDRLSKTDFKAIIDLSKLSFVNTVDVNVSTSIPSLEVIDITNKVINVNLEDITYAEFPVESKQEGTPSQGYFVKSIEFENPTLIITGAESQIKKIDKVIANFNVNDIRENITKEYIPEIYDKNGDLLPLDDFKFNIEHFNANIILEKTKNIPLNIIITDDSHSAGKIRELTYEPLNIDIVGPTDRLENINELKISFPLKIEIANDNNTKLTKVINLNEYLPEGIKLLNPDQKATISIIYDPYPSKTFKLNMDNINFIGANSNFEYDFGNKNIEITVTAPKEILDNLKIEELYPQIDVSEIKDIGVYEIVIKTKSDKDMIISNNMKNIIVKRTPVKKGA